MLTEQATEQIRKRMDKREITQRTLAKKINIHYGSLCRVLRRKTNPSVSLLSRICAELEMRIDISPDEEI
jgi:transcriptional regulator with XRE-family HTH domain